MPFKTILVSLNHASRKDALISASIALAAKHDAHLIGLYVVPKLRIDAAIVEAASLTAIDTVRVFFEERATATERAFNEAVSMAGVEAEWRKAEPSTFKLSDAVMEHGFQADLIIVSQKDEAANDGLEGDFCQRIIMGSGRPVLLIPLSGDFDHIGESVIVGWNATRESARAIFDALPLLEISHTTRLVWVDPQENERLAGDLPGSEMAATLARHGVNATAETVPTDDILEGVALRSWAGDVLLNRASDLGADLIVMGAYGHSRLREYILGGATRTLLHHMTVPVLMSH